jgi:hypothetical protein
MQSLANFGDQEGMLLHFTIQSILHNWKINLTGLARCNSVAHCYRWTRACSNRPSAPLASHTPRACMQAPCATQRALAAAAPRWQWQRGWPVAPVPTTSSSPAAYKRRSLWHPHLIRRVSRQDHIERFLTKQENTSAHTYKLNLNALKGEVNLSTIQGQQLTI